MYNPYGPPSIYTPPGSSVVPPPMVTNPYGTTIVTQPDPYGYNKPTVYTGYSQPTIVNPPSPYGTTMTTVQSSPNLYSTNVYTPPPQPVYTPPPVMTTTPMYTPPPTVVTTTQPMYTPPPTVVTTTQPMYTPPPTTVVTTTQPTMQPQVQQTVVTQQQGGTVVSQTTTVGPSLILGGFSQPQLLPSGTRFTFPTRWSVKQQWYSSGGDMSIRDAYGAEVFYADGKAWSLSTQMKIIDLRTGAQVAYIKQKLKLGMPQYNLYIGGLKFASFKQQFSLTMSKLKIDAKDGVIHAKGDWKAYDFQFIKGYKTVGYVSKQYTSGTDTYMVEINGGEDVLLFLCASVVLDKIFHE